MQYFNASYGRSGTLWEGRYRATVVDGERYLLTLMRYIELNPVRAGLVGHPRDYVWSSYRYNALGEAGSNADWITPHREYLRLGRNPADRQSAYRQLFRAAVSGADLAAIRDCTHEGWALGQRRAASKGVGRPRKSDHRG